MNPKFALGFVVLLALISIPGVQAQSVQGNNLFMGGGIDAGTLYVSGSASIGGQDGGNVSIAGTVTAASWTGDLLPTANGTQNLGSDTLGWNNGWISILSTRGSGGEVWAFAASGASLDFYSDQPDIQVAPAFTFSMNVTPTVATRVVLGAQYSTTQTIPSTDDYVWTLLSDGSMCINGLAGGGFGACTDKITAGTGSASLLTSVFVGAVTTATTTYGGDVLPAYPFTVSQATFRTSAAGSGGSTDFAFRVSDGTNHCDCTMACNVVAGNKNPTCAGAGGTGCSFAASASLTYSVNSIGDCTTGPTIVGNVQVRGSWK